MGEVHHECLSVASLQIDWPTAAKERGLCVSVFTSEDAVSESC